MALRILFVTPYLPSPPGFGGARRLHGLGTGLARRHEVSVLSLLNTAESHEESIRATGAWAREVVTVPNPLFSLGNAGKRALQLRSLASGRSFEWLTHVVPAMEKALRSLLARNPFDVINVEFSHLAPYRDAAGAGPGRPALVLDEHNVEFEILRRTSKTETGVVRRLYNAVDWRKVRAEEVAAWRAFDGCAVTSAHDRDLLLREVPTARTAVVPNAVDLEHFAPRPGTAVEPGSILFFGANNYFPNADGLRFFLGEIFPRIRQRVPGAKLRVVGHTPESLRAALSSDAVEMKGFVPDVRDEIARAALVIAPLRIGGGTRLKILEAMSMARPVVSTSQGAEGLEVANGREVLLADDAPAFADAVVRLLGDAALAAHLGASARALVETRYGWAASVWRLEELYGEVLEARRKESLARAPAPASR